MAPLAQLSLTALPGIPRVRAGDDLAAVLGDALDAAALLPAAGDVLVLAQKIVSKAEGRQIALATVTPSQAALELAARTGKDPRLVELILSETDEVMRVRDGLLIVRHRRGWVLANAGIDQSNIEGEDQALRLPRDPDASCAALRERLRERYGVDIAVMVIDSFGRAWRNGTIGTAIGASGLPGLRDLRGRPDLFGRPLLTSELGHADEIAAAASLLMGQADDGLPAVLLRGLPRPERDGNAAELVRSRAQDLFP
ncbi:coenzyme F420-0:L-glutamate ligase [Luteimonas saliphila]|uniref:coenzyme F420-0:L-glutamate ligase n=1 Tax=Luteimonas saliphila TaxID=2804919 RepID=UPI00192DA4FB|nr:coenzyme F420-0:L-glutamate ligase [Luteimonas saliphila]